MKLEMSPTKNKSNGEPRELKLTSYCFYFIKGRIFSVVQ